MTLLSKSDLLALPYTVAGAEREGLTAEDYRRQFRLEGEPIMWWKAFAANAGVLGPNGEVPDKGGRIYVQQTLDPVVRVMITRTTRELMDEEFGVLPKGSTAIACLPDEILLSPKDRVLLVNRRYAGRTMIVASGDATDPLPFQNIASITSVLGASGLVSASNYAVSAAGTGITWSGTPPTGNVSVELLYQPLYIYLDLYDQNPPVGHDALFLPQRGVLTKERVQ